MPGPLALLSNVRNFALAVSSDRVPHQVAMGSSGSPNSAKAQLARAKPLVLLLAPRNGRQRR